ncbi:MAG: cytoplasmic protein [Thermodesulfobacteriota bacterium]|nr:cytoplasmic protein [Thermodesulfobacteriota bacterium]
MKRETYRDFDATELYCPNCKRAVSVRKRLLLVLPNGEKYDYTCTYCGTSLGDKMVTEKDNQGLLIK